MFVRVFDKDKNTYYKSIVYSAVGSGWFLQFVVINPDTNTFELVDYLDKSTEDANPLVEIIQCDNSDFNTYEGSALLKFKHYCKNKGIEYTELRKMTGYPDVCENYAFLADIFTKKRVSVENYDISVRKLKDEAEWNYIFTQGDADAFMQKFVGFHDSTLETVNYTETNGSATANAVFDNSGWFGIVELCFEGVQMLKIIPAAENCTRDILEASLIVENECVFWADSYMKKADTSYDGSLIKALSLKWRKL